MTNVRSGIIQMDNRAVRPLMIGKDNLSVGSHGAVQLIDGFDALKSGQIRKVRGDRLELSAKNPTVKKGLVQRNIDFPDLLERAHSAYDISPDPKDHLFVSTIIFTTKTPNKNAVAFSSANLRSWSVKAGTEHYNTWVGKPTHQEHRNQNPLLAKGIIVDANMVNIKNMPNFDVVSLLATFDRSKDGYLYDNIKSGKMNAYSMGAMVEMYQCSVCGATRGGTEDPVCEHISNMEDRMYIDTATGKLVYETLLNTDGIELSSVIVPAYRIAVSDEVKAVAGLNLNGSSNLIYSARQW